MTHEHPVTTTGACAARSKPPRARIASRRASREPRDASGDRARCRPRRGGAVGTQWSSERLPSSGSPKTAHAGVVKHPRVRSFPAKIFRARGRRSTNRTSSSFERSKRRVLPLTPPLHRARARSPARQLSDGVHDVTRARRRRAGGAADAAPRCRRASHAKRVFLWDAVLAPREKDRTKRLPSPPRSGGGSGAFRGSPRRRTPRARFRRPSRPGAPRVPQRGSPSRVLEAGCRGIEARGKTRPGRQGVLGPRARPIAPPDRVPDAPLPSVLVLHTGGTLGMSSQALEARDDLEGSPTVFKAVSYTHLTLPTIYSV